VFLSADDLRVNLWNIENNKESFMIVDIKPPNMEELTEVITGACVRGLVFSCIAH
jgi:serine/threonine-protein phosphatase 2A regulatory subunit B